MGSNRSRRFRRGVVTVVAVATALTVVPAGAVSARFPDVPRNAYYADSVEWLVARGITTGVGNTGRFEPNSGVDRGQMVTFLWRFRGAPTGSRASGFPDVARGAYFAVAVDWARAQGITTGVGRTEQFRPRDPVTRAQMVTFLWRLAGEPRTANAARFPDVPRSAYFAAAVDWARARGITTGVGNTGRFAPNDRVTRGQMAAFLDRLARVLGVRDTAGTRPPGGSGTALRPGTFDVVLEGRASGNTFRRTAVLRLVPTITRVGTTNGVNPIDACLRSGNPGGAPQVGAIWYNTNSWCINPSGAHLDLTFVRVQGRRIEVLPDPSLSETLANSWTSSGSITAEIYRPREGGAIYEFSANGNRVQGAVVLRGPCGLCLPWGLGFGTYEATLTGTRR